VSSYRYYYFVPQLSTLAYGQAPPESSAAFRVKAADVLDARDAALLGSISLDPPPPASEPNGEAAKGSGCDFIDGWREWERGLRLHLVALRAARLGREVSEEPGFHPAAAAAAKALEAETPLEGEVAIDKARWKAVEALQGGELFHRNTIFAYLMKLLILERQASFQVEAGFSEYKTLYDSIILEERSGAAPMGESK